MVYITTADVEAILGAGWAGQGDPDRAVLMANTWLTGKIRQPVADPVPDAIKQAGAEIAKESAAGKMFAATEREVSSKEVGAQTGTYVKKSYTAGSVAITAGESFALALIVPWTRRPSVFMLQRV